MGYKNTSSLAFEAEMQVSGEYSIFSHGDLGAFHKSIMNADLPDYTRMFYHLSPEEQFAEFKYDKVSVDYDKGLKDIQEGMRGPPLEVYVPAPILMPDGAGKPIPVEILPKKTIVDEILKAQAELFGKSREIVFSEEQITILKHIRKRVLKLSSKE
ncbi:hypothetical protein GOV09_04775 [Candidatus Woesearchaeota archaeon]|nr:hypothetical protein [Candidatus Woesearchaeota archaeon]